MIKHINIGPSDGKKLPEILNNNKCFIKIYQPWCVHCHRLNPIWKNIVKKLKLNYNGDINLVNIHGDALADINIYGLDNIIGYPTIKYIINNISTDYSDRITANDIIKFCVIKFNLSKINKIQKLKSIKIKNYLKRQYASRKKKAQIKEKKAQ